MQYFAELHGGEDVPNAIAVWDRIAERVHAHLTRQHAETHSPQLPAVFSAFMPKSGGAFLFDRMVRGLGYLGDLGWCINRRGGGEVYPTDNAIKVYQRGGFFCQTQAQPSPWFRMVMDRHKTGPIWVHVRHPAEACMAGFASYLWSMQNAVRGQQPADLRDEIVLPGEAGNAGRGIWPAFFAEWLGFYAGWLAAWLDYADARPAGTVIFTYHDELADVRALLTRMFAAQGFGLAAAALAGDAADKGQSAGSAPDWWAGLSEADLAAQAPLLAVWDRMMARRAKEGPAVPQSLVGTPKAAPEKKGS